MGHPNYDAERGVWTSRCPIGLAGGDVPTGVIVIEPADDASLWLSTDIVAVRGELGCSVSCCDQLDRLSR